MSNIIAPRAPIFNREYKRVFKKEAQEILHSLENLNSNFIGTLFTEGNKESYNEIFGRFNAQWKNAIKRFEQEGRLQNTLVNISFFEELYKPVI